MEKKIDLGFERLSREKKRGKIYETFQGIIFGGRRKGDMTIMGLMEEGDRY